MRIAEISTLHRPVPPMGEGSIESLVSTLTEGLVERGHEVTLFASADSETTARLWSPVPLERHRNPAAWDWQIYEAFQVREAFRMWEEFDLIHCHSYHFGLLYCDLVPTPSLHSVHIEPGPDYRFLAESTTNRSLHFCSRFQAREFERVEGIEVIPHGVDPTLYDPKPDGKPGKYLAYLGRFHPDKGLPEAIEIAKKSGIPLKLAGPINDYYSNLLEPMIDGSHIQMVGEVDAKEKAKFLQDAKALLFPIQRGEPFGLVLIEAMACGVPVLATNRGAVSEIVVHGETGWIGESVEDLLEGIRRLEEFDPAKIRRHVEVNFSNARMVDRLENLMTRIVERNEA
ncbi:MAG: glycosyltransferase family 4 protein [Candidatus Omnitrophica bacterium]|nr:glycosyltransferase family 4 protein [Candidatus Omnitrophota bacterium]